MKDTNQNEKAQTQNPAEQSLTRRQIIDAAEKKFREEVRKAFYAAEAKERYDGQFINELFFTFLGRLSYMAIEGNRNERAVAKNIQLQLIEDAKSFEERH